MFDATELCRQLRIRRTELDAWIEAGWLRPARGRSEWRFATIDLARAQFILDLRDPMGVNDEGVAVILDLLDQVHGLRRALQRVASAIGADKSLPSGGQPAAKGLSTNNLSPGRAPRRGRAAA